MRCTRGDTSSGGKGFVGTLARGRVRCTRGEISSGDKLASWHVGEGKIQ